MAAETPSGEDVAGGSTDVADTGGDVETGTGGRLERFSSVQVFVHATLAVSIFVLYLTGLPMTFADQLGWLFSVFTYGNIVLIHVAVGVVFVLVGTYYLLYLAVGMLLERRSIPALPTLDDVREAVAYLGYLLGRNEKPPSKKYSWLQKAEIWVLAVELVVLSATGLLLWYRGIFVSPEFRAILGADAALADTLLLFVRDVHVVIALTMLMGISFHLYMVNVKERYPFNETMFSGDVSAGRAAHHWEEWADAELEAPPETDHTPRPSKRTLVGVTLALLAFFAVVLTATLLASILSPLPSREYLLALPADPTGAANVVFLVGLNAAVLVILAGAAAIVYGMSVRLRGGYDE